MRSLVIEKSHNENQWQIPARYLFAPSWRRFMPFSLPPVTSNHHSPAVVAEALASLSYAAKPSIDVDSKLEMLKMGTHCCERRFGWKQPAL